MDSGRESVEPTALTEQHGKRQAPPSSSTDVQPPRNRLGLLVRWCPKAKHDFEDRCRLESTSNTQRHLVHRLRAVDVDAEPAEQIGVRHRHRRSGVQHTQHRRQLRGDDEGNDRPENRGAVDVKRLTEVAMRIDPARLHRGSVVGSAQPDEHRLADTGNSLDSVGGNPEFGHPLQQRSELIGVGNNVARLVDCYPSASIPFDEIRLHDLNLTPRWQLWASAVGSRLHDAGADRGASERAASIPEGASRVVVNLLQQSSHAAARTALPVAPEPAACDLGASSEWTDMPVILRRHAWAEMRRCRAACRCDYAW